jgi:hypothetical protein
MFSFSSHIFILRTLPLPLPHEGRHQVTGDVDGEYDDNDGVKEVLQFVTQMTLSKDMMKKITMMILHPQTLSPYRLHCLAFTLKVKVHQYMTRTCISQHPDANQGRGSSTLSQSWCQFIDTVQG